MQFKKTILFLCIHLLGKAFAMETIPLRYWFWWPIRTFDTFEADTPPVMQIARNIYSTLISDYIDGIPQGILAKEWTVSADGKTWKFHLRKDLKFEDGSPITPAIILMNFKRILWLTKEEGLVLNSLLPEVKKWKSMHELSKSIYLDKENDLIFHFNKQPLGLFEAISQPLYGIAHPKCFDKNGKWINALETIASGQYFITKIGLNFIHLKSRNIFDQVKNAPKEASIYWPIEKGDTVIKALEEGRGDLTVEHSFAIGKNTLEKLESKGLKVMQEPPVRMHFLHLNHQRPPFNLKATRILLRDAFLKNLQNNKDYATSGLTVNTSFIPRGGIGYKEFLLSSKESRNEISHLSIDIKSKIEILLYPFSADKKIQTSIENSLMDALKKINIPYQITRYNERFDAFNRMRKGDFDIIIRGTGILVNNPYGDLRMMFLSSVGAKIPDPSGKIASMIEQAESEQLSKKRADTIIKINELIFNEASIITFAHSGLLYFHKGNIGFEHYNLFADPIEFRAISWNKQESKK